MENAMYLKELARKFRKDVLKMAFKAGGAHIAPAYSIIELLTVLYFGNIMRYHPQDPLWPKRDRLILSKGHACTVLYAILAECGFFEKELLDTYCQEGSKLGGHPNMLHVPGVEASTGSLGHGLAYGLGQALAAKMDNKDYRVFVLMGDGECQEGSVWEAALVAAQQKLGRLVAIVDYNRLQGIDFLQNISDMEPFIDKWKSFGWETCEVDGHCIDNIQAVLSKERNADAQPLLVLAHTVKGKGISYMENVPIWHYRLPNDEEMKIACEQLQIFREELES